MKKSSLNHIGVRASNVPDQGKPRSYVEPLYDLEHTPSLRTPLYYRLLRSLKDPVSGSVLLFRSVAHPDGVFRVSLGSARVRSSRGKRYRFFDCACGLQRCTPGLLDELSRQVWSLRHKGHHSASQIRSQIINLSQA